MKRIVHSIKLIISYLRTILEIIKIELFWILNNVTMGVIINSKIFTIHVDSLFCNPLLSEWIYVESPFQDNSNNFVFIIKIIATFEFKGMSMNQGISKSTQNQYQRLFDQYKDEISVDLAYLIPINKSKLVTYRKAFGYELKTVIDNYRPRYYNSL